MTLGDLKGVVDRLLEHADPDTQVVIPVSRGHSSVGPRHSAFVYNVSRGIDWDAHSIFVHPEEPLAAGQEKMVKRSAVLEKVREEVWMTMKMSKEKLKYYDFFKRVCQLLEAEYGEGLGIIGGDLGTELK